MSDYLTVSQYAKLWSKDPGNIRRMLIKGELKGEKVGNQWVIHKDTTYPRDNRVKTGNYRNWRMRSNITKWNPRLYNALEEMCKELAGIYGECLDSVVLYGSYARGQQEKDSDVDIALIINPGCTELMHDKMTDTVVDYELSQGITLSVISVEKLNYNQWKTVLPFYKNIAKEGLVLWKAM